MSRRILILLSLLSALAISATSPALAAASFGVKEFDLMATNADGTPATQAGSHPFAFTTRLTLNSHFDAAIGDDLPDGDIKHLFVAQIPGLVGDPTAIPACASADFLPFPPACPASTVIGTNTVRLSGSPVELVKVYNLFPPPGVAQELGFQVLGARVTLLLRLSPNPPYNVIAEFPQTIPQVVPFLESQLTLWGNPADPAHDAERGGPVAIANQPYLILPRACRGPLATSYQADSWQQPGAFLADGQPDLSDPAWVRGSVETHDDGQPPAPQGFTGCGKLGFSPSISAQPTSIAASSPTGLDFSLNVNDEGLANPQGIADSDIEKTEVTLPKGFTINPSIAEGLAVCTEADLARETAFSEAGAGCPNASKIGTVEVETPLLDENVNGSLYQAAPYGNPFHSLIALYIVIKNRQLGIKIVQPLKVVPDPVTGRLTTVAEDMPQLPFSHFRLHFREGTRSPLATPPACGDHTVTATLYPYSGGPPQTTTSTFQIVSGPDKGPCPAGGLPPFHPELTAGTVNNAAGAFSPFDVKITRSDSEQEITHFSIKLPPGVAGKLAGIPFCSDTAIAAATARTGPHGGQEEIDSPSCPAASQVGRTLAGAGVGPSLAYAPGKLYLAGPYHGAPLSIVSITAGVVGPFDIGTVVVRLAVRVNPETGEVFLDSTGSDPIPHIIKGIPVHLRDIRAYTDRPEFTYNPTNCEPTSTAATVLGSGLDFVSSADDNPFVATSPFQAADCASLGYAPKLGLRLRGSTKRGGTPALRAVLTPRPGDANSAAVSVALPHSEFLEQGHIRTICTRVQFNAGAGNGADCPAASIYGHARVWTPILAEPLEGPIFLRSSEHPLPDLVLALHGLIDFDAVGRIDSKNGGIRNSFDLIPDAPISKVVVSLQGGKKGLLVNSTNLCKGKNRATVKFKGQNGKRHNTHPVLKVKCKGKHRARAAR